jgi:hypothetical protein
LSAVEANELCIIITGECEYVRPTNNAICYVCTGTTRTEGPLNVLNCAIRRDVTYTWTHMLTYKHICRQLIFITMLENLATRMVIFMFVVLF